MSNTSPLETATPQEEHTEESYLCVYERPELLYDKRSHYCPGCQHGVTHRLVMEAIEELGIQGDTIGVGSVGCSVLIYNYMDIDMQESAILNTGQI